MSYTREQEKKEQGIQGLKNYQIDNVARLSLSHTRTRARAHAHTRTHTHTHTHTLQD
jgi:hypothetical protein